MKLPRPFFRLPLAFDAARLRAEVEALPESAWAEHPSDYEGNSSVRLISVNGGENDDVHGPMEPTAHLEACPYIQQVLESFGVVWSRSRLMRLAPRRNVPEHADINYHWFRRVRVHVPVATTPDVQFHCGGEAVHMGAGQAWIFDNWRRHRVENPSPHTRIHLVADTTGSAAFWNLVKAGGDGAAPLRIDYDPAKTARVLTERHNGAIVMPPAEVELLCGELVVDIERGNGPELQQLMGLLGSFCRDWQQLWLLHGDEAESGWEAFAKLRDAMRAQATPLASKLRMAVNQVPAQRVLEARLLQHVLGRTAVAASRRGAASSTSRKRFDRPIFIVAAPRSGSSVLFETLASTPQLFTVGGEAHWMIEGHEDLRPGARGIDSNRLTDAHVSDELQEHAHAFLAAELRDPAGRRWNGSDRIRLVEKTPKNALRVPLLERLFPDALFIHLWRDPRENISSILDAWRSGRWITYPRLEGWEGPPWSMLLPPGWRELRGKPLEDVAAYQWRAANDILLGDLQSLASSRWTTIEYADFVRDPAAVVQGLCSFAGLAFDAALAERTGGPLPHAQHTLTPPRADKWHQNREAIERVLPQVDATWQRLRGLRPFRL